MDRKWYLVIICVLSFNSCTLVMSEALQGSENNYDNPIVISTVVGGSYIYLLAPYWCWCWFKNINSYHSWGYTLKTSSIASILSLACRDSWYYSLNQTTDGSNSAIYRTCTGWVYLLSIIFLGELIDVRKLASLTLAVCGSVVVAVASTEKKEEGIHKSYVGYVDLFASVIVFAIFQIFIKKYISDPNDENPMLTSLRFCGCIGLWIVLWGPLSVLAWTLFTNKNLTFPPIDVLRNTIGIGVLDAMYTLSLIVCMHLTDPTFTSVSTILLVPMTVVADMIIHSYYPSAVSVVGTVIVLLGCFSFNMRAYSLAKSVSKMEEFDSESCEDDEKADLVVNTE